MPAPSAEPKAAAPASEYLSPAAPRPLQEKFAEDDMMTYPDTPLVKAPVAPRVDVLREKPSLLAMLGDILRYPISNKSAFHIFLTGAILFSPLVWKTMEPGRYLPCIGFIINAFIFITIVSVRLMYFSYLLLVIQKSAEGSQKIPELPVFQTWEQNLSDLLKVLGASVVAFSPFLIYAASSNIDLIANMWEASSRGESLGPGSLVGASTLGTLVLLYATAAFYMPMVLMALVVTRNFVKAVNPVFILSSIFRVGREYLAAMIIIFLFLRGSLTLFTMLKDILDIDWFTSFAKNLGEPIIEFYVLVVSMHVIGLLYYRNAERLHW
jgi:hypothetical protein